LLLRLLSLFLWHYSLSILQFLQRWFLSAAPFPPQLFAWIRLLQKPVFLFLKPDSLLIVPPAGQFLLLFLEFLPRRFSFASPLLLLFYPAPFSHFPLRH